MGRHRIRVKITAGGADTRDMLAWIEAFAAQDALAAAGLS